MKKTCNGCKAYTKGVSKGTCSLGFQFKDIYIPKTGSFIDSVPIEKCPKPKTNDEFVKLFLKS